MEVDHDAVRKHGQGDGPDVLNACGEATVKNGACLGADHQVLAGSWAGTPL